MTRSNNPPSPKAMEDKQKEKRKEKKVSKKEYEIGERMNRNIQDAMKFSVKVARKDEMRKSLRQLAKTYGVKKHLVKEFVARVMYLVYGSYLKD